MKINESDLEALLALHESINEELKKRKLINSKNNIVADYSEYLVCKALHLVPATGSNKGFDAKDNIGNKYEVKGRRPTKSNKSVQLGALRDLKSKHFNFLVCVIFENSYKVHSCYLIPHSVVVYYAKHRSHTNSERFIFNELVRQHKGVRDITARIKIEEAKANKIRAD